MRTLHKVGPNSFSATGMRKDVKVGDPFFTLALYGVPERQLDHCAFIDNMRSLCDGLIGPNIAVMCVSDRRKTSRWTKGFELHRDKRNCHDDITAITVSAKRGNQMPREPISDYHFYAELDSQLGYALASVSCTDDGSRSNPHFEQLLRGFDNIHYCYGIGYLRDSRKGPAAYAAGILHYAARTPHNSSDDYDDELQTCRWRHVGMTEKVYERGLIRGVYPYNILSGKCLRRTIEGIDLASWILANRARGVISEIGDGMYYWNVPEDNCRQLYQSLRAAGITLV